MKTTLMILFYLIGVNQLIAQNIKILSATEQSWSGGQCCSHGINYIITIESTDTVKVLKFDTVWIGSSSYTQGKPQSLSSSHYQWNGKMYYTITASQSWSGREGLKIDDVVEVETVNENIKAPKYKGKACILASSSNSKRYLEVDSFKLIPPIPYP
jgi:hypothetical protein